MGAKWKSWQEAIRDLGLALSALLAIAVIGNLSNAVLGPLQHDATAFHSMVAQNTIEAIAFLVAALTARFVEEFLFRGYIQRQCQVLCGSTIPASAALQVLIFTQGHFSLSSICDRSAGSRCENIRPSEKWLRRSFRSTFFLHIWVTRISSIAKQLTTIPDEWSATLTLGLLHVCPSLVQNRCEPVRI